MTKEEILLKETSGIFDEYEGGITGIFNAMDLFAKQQAIAFTDWLYKKYTQSDITDEWVERSKPLSKNSKSTQYIYNQFIEQQNKP